MSQRIVLSRSILPRLMEIIGETKVDFDLHEEWYIIFAALEDTIKEGWPLEMVFPSQEEEKEE